MFLSLRADSSLKICQRIHDITTTRGCQQIDMFRNCRDRWYWFISQNENSIRFQLLRLCSLEHQPLCSSSRQHDQHVVQLFEMLQRNPASNRNDVSARSKMVAGSLRCPLNVFVNLWQRTKNCPNQLEKLEPVLSTCPRLRTAEAGPSTRTRRSLPPVVVALLHLFPFTPAFDRTPFPLPLMSLNYSSAVDRVICLFEVHGLSENSLRSLSQDQPTHALRRQWCPCLSGCENAVNIDRVEDFCFG